MTQLIPDQKVCPSKWPRLTANCLEPNGIRPGSGEQLVVFTEYADTADWLVRQFRTAGWSVERYSGRDALPKRDEIPAIALWLANSRSSCRPMLGTRG